MEWWILVVLVFVVAALGPIKPRKRKAKTPPRRPIEPTMSQHIAANPDRYGQAAPRTAATPERASRLQPCRPLNDPERVLYYRLKLLFKGYEVLAQAPFSQFLYAVGGTGDENFAHMARVKQKVADFLICTKEFQPVAIVELDGKHHRQPKQQSSDAERDALLREAGIPTYRYRAPHGPTDQELQELSTALSQ